MSKKVKDAVSVIFTFKDEVFFIKRSNEQKSFPGYIAFIGGKVDKEDYLENIFSHSAFSYHPVHLINTLIREVKEETSLDINKREDIQIGYIGNALSPDFNPIRFNTYFFVVKLNEKPSFNLDSKEIEWGKWQRPKEILNEWKKGDHLIIPPIRYFLTELSKNINILDLKYKRALVEDQVPFVESISELVQFMPLSNTLPPADRTNAFLIKGDKNILVDPSPKDEREKDRLLNSLPNVDIIFITHYHRDHYEFSDEIARELGAPIFLSKETHTLILKHRGDDFFKEIQISFVEDSDQIGSWKNEDVKILSVPGHASGHCAIYPESKKWMIVGDLFQGVGSVVVGGENSSMKKYMESLSKVIEYNPLCVIPSHGIALGGVEIIKKNLHHRLKREEQVLKLFERYKNINKVYNIMYAGLDEKLRPYAMANIESHLKKLVEEKKIVIK